MLAMEQVRVMATASDLMGESVSPSIIVHWHAAVDYAAGGSAVVGVIHLVPSQTAQMRSAYADAVY